MLITYLEANGRPGLGRGVASRLLQLSQNLLNRTESMISRTNDET